MTEEPTSRSDPAHTARALLAPALADLEARVAPPPFATRALEHAAHAMSALYGAETEAPSETAAKSGLRKALAELSHALEALHEARDRSGDFESVTSAVAHALAFLYPLVSASHRQRREVVLPGAADGSVRWASTGEDGRSTGMGVGFSALGTDDRRAIADYCARRPPMFHE